MYTAEVHWHKQVFFLTAALDKAQFPHLRWLFEIYILHHSLISDFSTAPVHSAQCFAAYAAHLDLIFPCGNSNINPSILNPLQHPICYITAWSQGSGFVSSGTKGSKNHVLREGITLKLFL